MLDIKDIQCFEVNIPFTQAFNHGSAERSSTETVLVIISTNSPHIGYGEGYPRSYVTGESISSVTDFINRHYHSITKINTFEEVTQFLGDTRIEIDRNPAAWCAIETALLDLFAKIENKTVEEFLQVKNTNTNYQYTAILGDNPPDQFSQLFEYYRELGFNDFKIKLCNDINRDKLKLNCLNIDNNNISVRADANNLWESTTSAINYLNELDFPFLAIEEPLRSKEPGDLKIVSQETGLSIILDESLLKFSQVSQFTDTHEKWLVNARISKYGGLLRSIELINELIRHNIQIIVGAHVGESSLMTRVSWILADAANTHLRGQEGGFSTHLLTHDLFTPNLKIGRKGLLDDSAFLCRNNVGFGLQLSNNSLKQYTSSLL